MALALGIAFRSRPSEQVVAGVLDVPEAAPPFERSNRGRDRPSTCTRRPGGFDAAQRRDTTARDCRRPANLSIRSGKDGESARASGRARGADESRGPRRALAAARRHRHGPRIALHRLAAAGPARHEHHEHGHVEHQLWNRECARTQGVETAACHPDASWRVPRCRTCWVVWCFS